MSKQIQNKNNKPSAQAGGLLSKAGMNDHPEILNQPDSKAAEKIATDLANVDEFPQKMNAAPSFDESNELEYRRMMSAERAERVAGKFMRLGSDIVRRQEILNTVNAMLSNSTIHPQMGLAGIVTTAIKVINEVDEQLAKK